MTALQVHVEGIGLYGPGLTGWSQARELLGASGPIAIGPVTLPAPEALPPAERRRVGLALKLAMAAGFEAVTQAQVDAGSLPSVFSSTGGDCDNCHLILETLASADRTVSPTRFHNSVHNMPAGYWSIATKCMAPTTSLCAYDATFAAGLLEAACQVTSTQSACLLVAYDTAYPEPLYASRPIPHAFGLAMVLRPEKTARTLCSLSLALGDAAPTVLSQPELEQLRTSVPAARSLPLMRALARGDGGSVVIDYLDDLSLRVDVKPC
ncbi:beta-ketoacyl synthase chain length factor [Ramlibacter sp. MMS24-I3-19]|uniref:beta-ketoacyl synthase chain length factor n=1 Tax=Ramlibacter sp. MMS24-I3-19 TaxID=3416606 RepID=UPI003D082757